MKIEVNGITLVREADFSKPFTVVAFADIALPDIETTLKGVAFARKGNEWLASAPRFKGHQPGDTLPVSWNGRSKFAFAMAEKILAAYYAMGGREPPEPTDKQVTFGNASRRISEKRESYDSGLKRALRVEREVDDTLEAAGI